MMVRSLWTGATGMHAQQTNIDVVANDLANVNTHGYKKNYVTFADLFYQRQRASGVQALSGEALPTGIQVGNGVRVTGTNRIFTRGNAFQTNIGTNMMIRDEGNLSRNFFEVDDGTGNVFYTRDGSFSKDSAGNLVLPNGYILPGITLPTGAQAQDVTITAEGIVQYKDANGATQQAGQVQLATFTNPAGLEPVGDNLFQANESSGTATTGNAGAAGFGDVLGGWVEMSNVNAIDEMVKLISAQRAYEFNSRSIQTSDEMLQTVNNLKR
ncbi:MAG: flagellar basal-body rod protein FlgG [Planctomycetota bacterium]|jgi:flagellar basal-body rod protein FlgG